jgi:site-specific recombinase XerD
MIQQSALFDKRPYKASKAQLFSIEPPAADQGVIKTIPAYHAYLSAGKFADTTPDDYRTDIKRLGLFIGSKEIKDITKGDIERWIGELKKTMTPKTLNRKVSAVGNYFRWLMSEHVLTENPAASIRAEKVHAPLPNLLYEEELDRLLKEASNDPRAYLLVLLFLETGMKKSELIELQTGDFDFSNKYQPEVWVKHKGKSSYKDRKLKLSSQLNAVFSDYTEQYHVSGLLFPYTPQFLSKILAEVARKANIQKEVSATILRDMFVVRYIKNGGHEDAAFEKIGLSPSSYDDARKKYRKLTRAAL